MILRRSLLFAPGNRPEAHDKALRSGADVVCLDLEDAVPPGGKAEARRLAVPFLGEAGEGPERALRINSLRSAEGLRDLLAVIEAGPSGGVVFLPKVASDEEVRIADDLLSEAGLPLGLAVLIESNAGLEQAAAICRASPRTVFAMFGGADLAAELGVALEPEPLAYARSRVVHAARAAGIDALDVPSLNFRDPDTVKAEALTAKRLGFSGKGAIHPSNVRFIHAIFAPSDEEVARAEAVTKAFRESPNGLAVLDGRLVEKPVARAAERVLAARDASQRRHEGY